MKRYVATLDERAELSEIKGSHLPQKVINALLNCDEGAFNECQMTGKVIAGDSAHQHAQSRPGEEAFRGRGAGGGVPGELAEGRG